MKFRNFVPAFIFLIVAMGLALTNNLGDKPNFMPSMVGKEIPEFSTETLDGKAKVTNKDLHGKIINFWATWCVSCKAEHPELLKLKAEGYQIIGVNSGDNRQKAIAYLGNHGNPFAEIAYDPSRKLAVAFGTTGMPETFVVDNSGKIIFHYRGALNTPLVEELKAAITNAKLK